MPAEVSGGGPVPAGSPDTAAENVLDVSVERDEPALVVLRLTGEIDMLTTPILKAAIEQQLAGHRRAVVVDLGAVTFLASSGLAALVESHRAAVARNVALRLVTTSREVARPIEATGLGELLDLYDDVDVAVAAGGEPPAQR